MVHVTITVPEGLDPRIAKRVAIEALNARASRGRIEAVLSESESPPGPGMLAQLALHEEGWREVESRWGTFSSEQVTKETGGNVTNSRAHTANLRRRKLLAGVRRGGRTVYPTFEFGPGKGGSLAVAPAWSAIAKLAASAEWDTSDLILWAAAPNTWLDGRSPAEEIQISPAVPSDRLTVAARHAFSGDG
jgi:hypothetical protein